MPLTPFHWSALFFGLVLFDFFYLPALVVSSVVMDIEPFYYLFLAPRPDFVLHGFFHTYLGVTLIGLLVGWVLVKLKKRIDKQFKRVHLDQPEISDKKVLFSSLFAAYSHVLLDSLMHADLQPFWPLTDWNPFLGLVSIGTVYELTGFFLLVVTGLFLFRIFKPKP